MNTLKRVALFIGACVAVLLSTSCSAETPNSSDPNAGMPAFTAHSPKNYDLWEQMNSGETLSEMSALAPVFGVDAINIPSKKYFDDGMVGVAKLEDYCVLSFDDAGTSVESGEALVTMTMMSRYNASYILLMPDLPPANVSMMIEKYRPVCTGASDFPSESIGQGQNA